MTLLPPYPLSWPDMQPRSTRREASKFKTTRAKAIDNVERSLRLFGSDSGRSAKNVVVTSNVAGLASIGQPKDPGVAVWFEWDGQSRCIAVDRYAKVEENLQAIHHVLEARRTEMRHAGIEMVRTTFRGLTALPPPPPGKGAVTRAEWWQVLEVEPTADTDQIKSAYRSKSRAGLSD
ncbi:MAG: J domain-containing protein, partial [Paracoccaceae bacterium]